MSITQALKQKCKAQRDRARAARNTETSMGVQSALLTDIKVDSTFIGYDHIESDSELLVIVQDETIVSELSDGEAQLIFDQTPFYAEMGGQVADQGWIIDASGETVANVTDVRKAPNGQFLHKVEVLSEIKEGNTYHLLIDEPRRNRIIKTIRLLTYCTKH